MEPQTASLPDAQSGRSAVRHVDPAKVELAKNIQPDRDAPAGPWHVALSGKSELIADIPDNVSAAAVAIAAASTGHLETKMTPLLTVEEIDQALSKQTEYRPPGQKG